MLASGCAGSAGGSGSWRGGIGGGQAELEKRLRVWITVATVSGKYCMFSLRVVSTTEWEGWSGLEKEAF